MSSRRHLHPGQQRPMLLSNTPSFGTFSSWNTGTTTQRYSRSGAASFLPAIQKPQTLGTRTTNSKAGQTVAPGQSRGGKLIGAERLVSAFTKWQVPAPWRQGHNLFLTVDYMLASVFSHAQLFRKDGKMNRLWAYCSCRYFSVWSETHCRHERDTGEWELFASGGARATDAD